ncbi:hypothetical protein ACFZAV_01375 [Streptomyces sp. NPDC008343]|uniref:hypothetical protein n=1 Tax=Streptomyces sp. NPDC008343 TaxID=3364828 RepID=UPI0036EEF8B6
MRVLPRSVLETERPRGTDTYLHGSTPQTPRNPAALGEITTRAASTTAIYERPGFVRMPERDRSPIPRLADITLLTHKLTL